MKFKARRRRKSTGFQIKIFVFESQLYTHMGGGGFLNIHNLFELPLPHWKNEANNRICKMSFEVIAIRTLHKARDAVIIIIIVLFSGQCSWCLFCSSTVMLTTHSNLQIYWTNIEGLLLIF